MSVGVFVKDFVFFYEYFKVQPVLFYPLNVDLNLNLESKNY